MHPLFLLIAIAYNLGVHMGIWVFYNVTETVSAMLLSKNNICMSAFSALKKKKTILA